MNGWEHCPYLACSKQVYETLALMKSERMSTSEQTHGSGLGGASESELFAACAVWIAAASTAFSSKIDRCLVAG